MLRYFEFSAGLGPALVTFVLVAAVVALAHLARTYLVLRFCRDLVLKTGGSECLQDAAAVLRALDQPLLSLPEAGTARPARRAQRRVPPDDSS
ncbi:MAG: hypothetical protein ACRDYX_20975 [Egibacteraceae bacterium]